MEIITERLEREFDLDLITTTPGVQYRLTLTDGEVEVIDNPAAYPDPTRIERARGTLCGRPYLHPERLCRPADGLVANPSAAYSLR